MLLVDDVVAGGFERFPFFGFRVAPDDLPGLEARDDAIDLVVEIGGLGGRPRNDQRGARFVDQDAVHLVDDREVMPALHVVRELELHVVAQVVEAELVVGAVGDVGVVGDLPLGVVQFVLDDADRHAEEPVDASHPLGVAARQVVVHRDNVDAFAFERVQVGGQGGDERLAFAGFHLGDAAQVEHRATDELDVEVPHVHRAPARLADHRKGFGHHVVERFAGGQASPELGRLAAQLFVGERLESRLERRHLLDDRAQLLQIAFVLGADDLREECLDHLVGPGACGYLTILAEVSVRAPDLSASSAGLSASGDAANGKLLAKNGRLGEELQGIEQLAVGQDFVVEMRTGRAARGADKADHVAAADGFARS